MTPQNTQRTRNIPQESPHLNLISDLESVYKDLRCRNCNLCMERAIKAYKTQNENMNNKDTTTGVQKYLIDTRYEINDRPKRDLDTETKPRRNKMKKKSNKTITVTKYNIGGSVYGLKVKERAVQGSEPNNNVTSTCHVYSVKKTYDCNSPESEVFLSVAKRNVHKKSKKEKAAENSTPATTTEKAHFMVPSFKKRQVDQSEMAENFEFSIEETY